MKPYIPVALGLIIIVATAYFVFGYGTMGDVSDQPASAITPAVTSGMELPDVTPTAAVTPSPSGVYLTITGPQNQSVVTSPEIAVRGSTIPSAEVFVNDAETVADASGNFSVSLTLDEGENYILIVANDAAGNFSERELFITYVP